MRAILDSGCLITLCWSATSILMMRWLSPQLFSSWQKPYHAYQWLLISKVINDVTVNIFAIFSISLLCKNLSLLSIKEHCWKIIFQTHRLRFENNQQAFFDILYIFAKSFKNETFLDFETVWNHDDLSRRPEHPHHFSRAKRKAKFFLPMSFLILFS